MAPALELPDKAAGEFFIADRLRGIPLVSAGKSWARDGDKKPPGGDPGQQDAAAGTQTKATEPPITTTATSDSHTSEATHKAPSRANLVGKREAGNPLASLRGARIQSQSEILFKQAGVTSSVANLVKSTTRTPQQPQKTTTTTRRPQTTSARKVQQAARPATTRAPQTTTSTTRRPPPAGRLGRPATATRGQILAKLIKANSPRELQAVAATSASTTAANSIKLPEPISSHKMSTLEAASGTSGTFFASTLPLLTSTSAPASKAAGHHPQPASPLETALTKAMQTLTTQPVNQRRSQQTVSQSRAGSHRLLSHDPRNGYAGEKWHFFQRSDGNFSYFEILVLISNVLIVSTIILVILLNWIKLLKRKKDAGAGQSGVVAKAGQQPATSAPSEQMRPGVSRQDNGNKLDASSDRASKMSLVSSGVTSLTTSAHDAPTTATTAATEQLKRDSNSPGRWQLDGGQRFAADGAAQLAVAVVGSSQKIASEITHSAVSVANKATAIVQPTGSSSKQSADGATAMEHLKRELKSELDSGMRSISRSVSDLSGQAQATNKGDAPAGKTTDDLGASARSAGAATPDRVQTLEELFIDTKREAQTKKAAQVEAKAGKKKREPNQEPGLHSSSSLESIELPAKLVDSIKRTAPGPLRPQVDETLVPSPNLLLGEVAEPARDEQQQKPALSASANALPVGDAIQDQVAEKTNESQTSADRPQNPFSRELAKGESDKSAKHQGSNPAKGQHQPAGAAQDTTPARKQADQQMKPAGQPQQIQRRQSREQLKQPTAEVKNHQVVVNKLDKHKTNLEIVDLRDESVTGKMRAQNSAAGNGGANQTSGGTDSSSPNSAWISMDGVAVVQPQAIGEAVVLAANQPGASSSPAGQQPQPAPLGPAMSPSDIIESRFSVDYKSRRRQQGASTGQVKNGDSVDSKQEEYIFNNIESELEQDNKMKNRKYFVYVVHDGHFTAKKECIARIELPSKRRTTLAELRQLIASSQDISLSSLRRNRFKFVTETYRLLNENEDAAVLHQVYPTQGVFLKLNVAEQENQVYPFKGGRSARLSSGTGGIGATSGAAPTSGLADSSLSNTTIASRRRANTRPRGNARNQDDPLPAIEVDNYGGSSGFGGGRASSVGRVRQQAGGGPAGGAYKRSRSSVQPGRNQRTTAGAGMKRGISSSNVNGGGDSLPSIGRSKVENATSRGHSQGPTGGRGQRANLADKTIGEAASDLGANMISGAKRLFTSTFHL